MGKFHQLSPELWTLIDVILCSYIELIFRVGVSYLPAALLFAYAKAKTQISCSVTAQLISALCFHYIGRTIPTLAESEISSL